MTEQARPRTVRLADLLDDGFAEASAAHEAFRTGQARGPVIPLSPKLEREIGGFLPVGVTVLNGPPGSAKTALANQIAGDCGAPALVVSCEISPLDLLRRHAARVTGTFLGKFRSGEISPSEWLALMRRTVATMPALAILDGTRGPVTIDDIREAAEATAFGSQHSLVIVDSLNSWIRGSGAIDGRATEYDATNEALAALQRLAADLHAAVVVVAEQNRASMGSDRQESSAGSRVFEYCAESVVALYRDPAVLPDADGEIPIIATLAKNRHGSAGSKVELRFSGRLMRFREPDGAEVFSLDSRRGRNRSA
jgi:replicative DNA helicase